MKRCYYEVLEVDRKASAADIKTGYRKMALKYHPDKNPGDQQAKSLFILVQQAYETLSDPNERTWYDTNREKILFNKDQMSKQDIEMHTFGFNIWVYFSHACFKGYDDEEGGFYMVYREVFQNIKNEERKAYGNLVEEVAEQRKYQGFGDSKTGIDKVLKFYEDWTNFNTYKSFVWKEEWDTKEAPNRYVRREMEKENKKERLKEKKHYLKTIKDLIDYLKKRDPRYKVYMDEQRQVELKKEQEKKLLQEQLKIQKQQQKLISKQMEQERLKEIQEYHKSRQQQNPHKQSSSEEQQQPASEYYCDLCEKGFKTKNQLENHKNSKQHKQNMKIVFKEVALEEDKVKQAADLPPPTDQRPSKKKKRSRKKNKQQQQADDDSDDDGNEQPKEPVVEEATKKERVQQKEEVPKEQPKEQQQSKPQPSGQNKKKKNKKKKDQLVISQPSQDDEAAKPVQQPKKAEPKRPQPQEDSDDEDDFMTSMLKNKQQRKVVEVPVVQIKPKVQPKVVEKQESEEEVKEIGKAKAKKLKKAEKAEKEAEEGKGGKFKCSTCGLAFPSKTKLFDHIKELGHAQAIPTKK